MAISRVCSIPNCGKPLLARGWCSAHWTRWQRHGDPLGGGTPIGAALRFYEDVALPYDGDECLIWPYSGTRGYGHFYYNGRVQLVSRVLCEAINGPPPSSRHEAAHSCGKGHEGCVTKNHLRWATPKENEADKITHGTTNRGERQGSARLTADKIRQIRRLSGTMPLVEIGKQFGVHPTYIGQIVRRQRWAHIE